MRQTIAILFALLLVTPSPARADANASALAAEHARRGKALAGLGHLREAIAEYDLAFGANPEPKYIYNKALLEQRLATAGAIDDMRHALDDYTRYLNADPTASDRTTVEARIIELRAKIESAEAAARDPSVRTTEAPPAPGTDPKSDPKVATAVPIVPSAPATPVADSQPEKKSRKALWIGLGVAGGVVLVGAAVGLGVGLSQAGGAPSTTLGGVNF